MGGGRPCGGLRQQNQHLNQNMILFLRICKKKPAEIIRRFSMFRARVNAKRNDASDGCGHSNRCGDKRDRCTARRNDRSSRRRPRRQRFRPDCHMRDHIADHATAHSADRRAGISVSAIRIGHGGRGSKCQNRNRDDFCCSRKHEILLVRVSNPSGLITSAQRGGSAKFLMRGGQRPPATARRWQRIRRAFRAARSEHLPALWRRIARSTIWRRCG